MRPDFPKLLCERERRGSSWKSYREVRSQENALNLVEDDDGIESNAHCQRSMSRPQIAGYNNKEFSENLNPLKKWLLKNVGRPWRKVYSELREHFKPTNTINRHIYQHLFQYVELNPQLNANGEVCAAQYGYDGTLRTLRGDSRFPQLYVDAHGILRQPQVRQLRPAGRPSEYVGIDLKSCFAKVDGLWYVVDIRARLHKYDDRHVSAKGSWTATTPVFESHHCAINPKTVFGWPHDMLATSKKQLSRKELKRHGLVNDTKTD